MVSILYLMYLFVLIFKVDIILFYISSDIESNAM